VWKSNLTDYAIKVDYNYYPNPNNTIKFGFSTVNHRINPGTVIPLGNNSVFNIFEIPNNFSLEHGIYASNEQKIGDRLNIKYGIRFSAIQNIGKAQVYKYTNDYKVKDTINYSKNQIYKTYSGWEPRLGMAYELNEESSVKASYSRTFQYLQLASNSTGGMPLDIWFSSSPNIKPQEANQVALGYFKNFMDHKLEASIETYYKKMNNSIDFKDFATLLLNKFMEGEVRVGKAKSYGAEFMLQYNGAKLSGWLSYTLSHTVRQVPGINEGREYAAPYDKPNNINVVLNYELTDRLSFSANWVYASGLPATLPVFRYEFDGIVQKGYTDRNSYRLQAYHRLDLSLTLKQKGKNFGLWDGEWVFGLYNAYNRHNIWMLNFVQDGNSVYAEKISILPVLPSVTYNFKF
jgi:outer membrane receptor protein involved in Fe transport